MKRICDFIDEAIEKLEGVFIHSGDGKSRCAFVVVLYLMNRYVCNYIRIILKFDLQ